LVVTEKGYDRVSPGARTSDRPAKRERKMKLPVDTEKLRDNIDISERDEYGKTTLTIRVVSDFWGHIIVDGHHLRDPDGDVGQFTGDIDRDPDPMMVAFHAHEVIAATLSEFQRRILERRKAQEDATADSTV
jgi:hypothetical protein